MNRGMDATTGVVVSQAEEAYLALTRPGFAAGRHGCGDGGIARDLRAILCRDSGGRLARRLQAASWLRLESALRSICGILGGSGIEAWGYKGADYAFTLYPDPCLRPMSDLDLIVRPGRILDAACSLGGRGWRPSTPGSSLLTSGIVSGLLLSKDGIALDLHSHPSYFPSTIPGRLPHPSDIPGTATDAGFVSPPSPYRLLLSLMHMHRHGAGRAIWWVDAALLARGLDQRGWGEFARLASGTGLSRRLVPLLEAVGSFEGIEIPRAVGEAIAAAPDRWRCLDPGAVPWRGCGTLAALLTPGGDREKSRNASRSGFGTLAALLTMGGWKRSSFLPVVLLRLATGAPPRRGGKGAGGGV